MRRGAETKEDISKRFIMRSFWVFGFFVFFSIILILRSTYLQVLNKDFLIHQGNLRQLKTVGIAAYRGTITDRNNKTLAISIPVDHIKIYPKKFDKNTKEFNELAYLIEKDPNELRKSIQNALVENKTFLYIKKNVETSISNKIKILEIPNLELERNYKRSYPAGKIVSQLLGLTSDEKGLEGIERQYDGSLKGVSGKKTVLRDRHKRQIENIEIIKSPQAGMDLTLSIDLRLQHIAYRALESAVIENQAISGSAILVDVLNSEILAIANHPTYDNNKRRSMSSALMRNRAIIDMYEPGSSIKPFIIARAIETGDYDNSSIIDTSPVRIGSRNISDASDLGFVDLPTVLMRSSNAGMSRIALSLESDKLWGLMSDFGFGSYVTDGFPGESRGQLHHHSEWGEIGKATMSYGYGISVTPIQLAQAYAAIANKGVNKPLSLRKNNQNEGKRIIKEETALKILKMLEKVVVDGTSKKAKVEGYRVGGKSGTVWKISGTGGYSNDRYRAIFAGVAPIEDPRLVAVVLIDEPTGEFYYGGDVAAPVFSEIISESLQLLAIPPDENVIESVLLAESSN
ncbi:MAG: cell division protein [Woeseiaceae bacterium]|nr:cell division protein [Woeseiaceae bacterium]